MAEVFEGYNSQVDWPGAAIWRETSVAFPDAKVLHTERPEDEWWNSFSVTIGKFFDRSPNMALPPHIADIFQTMSGWFMKNTFADHTDRDCAISAYRRNNEEVRDTIPAERLLVFNVAEGWGPLCRFLESRNRHAFSAQPSAGRILGAFRRRASLISSSLSRP